MSRAAGDSIDCIERHFFTAEEKEDTQRFAEFRPPAVEKRTRRPPLGRGFGYVEALVSFAKIGNAALRIKPMIFSVISSFGCVNTKEGTNCTPL